MCIRLGSLWLVLLLALATGCGDDGGGGGAPDSDTDADSDTDTDSDTDSDTDTDTDSDTDTDTECVDPVEGAPEVASGDQTYEGGTTSGVYTLSFTEDVTGVDASSVTWTPTVGEGTMDSITPVGAQAFEIAFSGAKNGDEYTIAIGTSAVDTCDNPLAAGVEIALDILNPDCDGVDDGAAQVDLCGQCVGGTTGLVACPSMAIEPVADAYVDSAWGDANHGSEELLSVHSDDGRRTFLRFDLGDLPTDAVVQSVRLSALAYDGLAWEGDGSVYTRFVEDDTWGETTITWNNQPPAGEEAIGSWLLWYDETPIEQWGENSDAALAPVVQGERAGDGLISFRLDSPACDSEYRSREYADVAQRPKLEIGYLLPETVALAPVADAYIIVGSDGNYGAETSLHVAPADHGGYMSFLRFDLGAIPAGSEIVGAELGVLAYSGVAWGGDGNVYTRFVEDDTWGETTITWNNQPAAASEAIGYWWIWYGGTTSDQWGVNADPALASTVQGEVDGDGLISVRIASTGYSTSYRSREHSDEAQRPYLQVSYLP